MTGVPAPAAQLPAMAEMIKKVELKCCGISRNLREKNTSVPFLFGVGIVTPEEKSKDFFEIEGFPALRDQLVYIYMYTVYICGLVELHMRVSRYHSHLF